MNVRRRFSKEFKIGAAKLVTEQGYTIGEAARRLEIDRKCLYDWLGLVPHFGFAKCAVLGGRGMHTLQSQRVAPAS